MKKTLYITMTAVAAVIALAGCAKVEEHEAPAEQKITITASFAEDQTKTTIQDGGTQVLWEVGDEIKVFYDRTGSRFCSTLTEPAATSDFSGSLNFVFGVNEGVGGSKELYAVYPYRADATSNGSSITTTLPTEQTGKAGSFAKGMNISMAKSSSFNMGFYNVCGGVRFSVTRDDVKNVVFKSLNGESLAGKVKIAFDGGVPAVQEVVEGKDSIILTAPAGGAFEKGKWYYIVALPGTLSGGFKMTFNTDTKYALLKSTDSREIKRGKFGSLADADDGLIYKDKGTPEPTGDFIVFKDPIAKYACVEKFDTDGDGEVSYDEAAAVTSIAGLFTDYNTVTRFDELKYFTGITSLSSAMKGLTALKSVTVPSSVTSLENSAFDGCTALDSITFAGNSVKTIGNYAFSSCAALDEIDIPSGVTSIGSYAFFGCSNIVEIGIPSTLSSIGQYSFGYCLSLKSLELPTGVTSISSYCFRGCFSLGTIGLPSGLTNIGSYAFSGCTKLQAVEFPSTVKTIAGYAFQNCQSLKSVSVPNSVTSFGSNVFAGCSSLESANLPSGLTSIPSGTFSECTSLCHFTFPEAVATIGDDAFRYCSFFDKSTRIAKIELPSTVTSIGSRALNNARNVLVTSSSFVTIQSNTFSVGTRIFVPDAKVDAYKIRTNWSTFASYIYPLSSYTDEPFEMESVDLGLSVKWATCNIGAYSPEQYGTYFAWGDVKGQLWGDGWSGGGFYDYPSYELDENNNLKPEYDAAHVNLGGTWRMPTKAEQQELIDNCTATWTSDYNGTGVAGRIFTSNKEGYTDKSIFLPAAGCGYDGDLYNAGFSGIYWSSTFSGGDYAWYLDFRSGYVYTYYYYRSYGRSVRPVKEE